MSMSFSVQAIHYGRDYSDTPSFPSICLMSKLSYVVYFQPCDGAVVSNHVQLKSPHVGRLSKSILIPPLPQFVWMDTLGRSYLVRVAHIDYGHSLAI